MQLRILEFARYAAITNDAWLTIAGVFDGVTANVPTQEIAATVAAGPIPVPSCYLVFSLTCSLSEGTDHEVRLRIDNEDEEPSWAPARIPVRFLLNRYGLPMRFHGVAVLDGLTVPRAGDYTFRLFEGETELGSVPLHVEVRSAQ